MGTCTRRSKVDFDQKFKNPRLVYRNLGDGHFKDVSSEMGPGISDTTRAVGRPLALRQ